MSKPFGVLALNLVGFIWALAMFTGQTSLAQNSAVSSPHSTTTVDQDIYREISGQLRCPTCTGLSVLDSEAAFSVQIRNEVKDQLAKGKKESEILQFFVDRYGPWILRAPPVKGVNALAWIVPGLFLLVGPLLIWFFLGRKALKASGVAVVSVRPVPVILAEMQAKLRDLRQQSEGQR